MRTHFRHLVGERVIVEHITQQASTGSEEEPDLISEEIESEFCSLETAKPFDVMRFLSPRETIVLKSMKTCCTYNFTGYGQTSRGFGKLFERIKYTKEIEVDVPRFEFDAEYLDDKLQQKLMQKYIKIKNG